MESSATPAPDPKPGEPNRCPNCGALVARDADWCGQCFTPLRAEKPSTEELAATAGFAIAAPVPAAAGSGDAPGAQDAEGPGAAGKVRLTWKCPACELDNDIELSFCARCGTSFASFMKADEAPVTVEPIEALKWSLIYPGLGHRKAGHGPEGMVRATLFTLSLVFLLMVALSGWGSAAQTGMVALYLMTTVAIYAGSAAEAYRIASGGSPFVSARTLLWATVGLLLVSIGLLVLTATTAVRG